MTDLPNIPHPNSVEDLESRPNSVGTINGKEFSQSKFTDTNVVSRGIYTDAKMRDLMTAGDLTEGDLKQYERAFKLFDKDGGGYITCSELKRVMHSLGLEPSVDELHYMISAADLNRSGMVELDEFIHMMSSYNTRHPNDEDDDEILTKIFQVFDRSKDGFINMYEVKHVMEGLGETVTDEELRAMLNVADTSGDGIVTYEEFRSICAPGDMKKRLI